MQQRRQLEAQQQEGDPTRRNKQKFPDVEVIADIGGVLTPAGVLEAETSLEYDHNASNRLVFNGVEIVDAVLVSAIEASDTDRFEINTKIPFVYRYDRFRSCSHTLHQSTDSRKFPGRALNKRVFTVIKNKNKTT